MREGAVEEAIQLRFALIEHKLPESLFERSANAILDVARAAYPRNSAAASTLIRQGSQLALNEGDIDPSTLGQMLLDAGKMSQDFGDLPLATELLKASQKLFSACFGDEGDPDGHEPYICVYIRIQENKQNPLKKALLTPAELSRFERRYRRLKEELLELGWIAQGSVLPQPPRACV